MDSSTTKQTAEVLSRKERGKPNGGPRNTCKDIPHDDLIDEGYTGSLLAAVEAGSFKEREFLDSQKRKI